MSKKATTKSKTNAELRSFYGLVPWRCNHHADRSEIVAYVEASGRWETVAVIPPTSGASAEALATFIARVVNATQQNKSGSQRWPQFYDRTGRRARHQRHQAGGLMVLSFHQSKTNFWQRIGFCIIVPALKSAVIRDAPF